MQVRQHVIRFAISDWKSRVS